VLSAVVPGSFTAGGWETASGILPSLAPGVEVVHRNRFNFPPVAAYPPASFFARQTVSGFPDEYLQFAVSVPEPQTVVLAIIALALIGAFRARVRKPS
jgi:hypothetical protein